MSTKTFRPRSLTSLVAHVDHPTMTSVNLGYQAMKTGAIVLCALVLGVAGCTKTAPEASRSPVASPTPSPAQSPTPAANYSGSATVTGGVNKTFANDRPVPQCTVAHATQISTYLVAGAAVLTVTVRGYHGAGTYVIDPSVADSSSVSYLGADGATWSSIGGNVEVQEATLAIIRGTIVGDMTPGGVSRASGARTSTLFQGTWACMPPEA
jgi:hypothetical protein